MYLLNKTPSIGAAIRLSHHQLARFSVQSDAKVIVENQDEGTHQFFFRLSNIIRFTKNYHHPKQNFVY